MLFWRSSFNFLLVYLPLRLETHLSVLGIKKNEKNIKKSKKNIKVRKVSSLFPFLIFFFSSFSRIFLYLVFFSVLNTAFELLLS